MFKALKLLKNIKSDGDQKQFMLIIKNKKSI